MGTHQKLSERQVDILYLINELENGLFTEEDLFSEEERSIFEKLCGEAVDSYEMSADEVESIVIQLRHYSYIGDDLKLTADGRQYLEVGYIPETVVNNIIINNIEKQNNIAAKKYVERNAPAVELGSAVSLTGVSVENKESLVTNMVKEVVKDVGQSITDKVRK